MIEFIKRIIFGEPVYFFGAINTVFVALALSYEWAAIASVVTVPLTAFVTRNALTKPAIEQ
jgi:hypothetical protein